MLCGVYGTCAYLGGKTRTAYSMVHSFGLTLRVSVVPDCVWYRPYAYGPYMSTPGGVCMVQNVVGALQVPS